METMAHPYQYLTPDLVLDAVEACGFTVNGRLFPLNSYENRVYQVGIEGQQPLIAKFYRPGRWSRPQLEEEHGFVAELEEADIPAIGALPLAGGGYLADYGGFTLALYPQRGGQAPDITMPDTLYRIGQWLGRIHQVGARSDFQHRPTIDPVRVIDEGQRYVLDAGFVPDDLVPAYRSLIPDLLDAVKACQDRAGDITLQRLHGDCHLGNILVREEQLLFVDFDDARQGPAIQDIWLMLSGDAEEQRWQLGELTEGYEQFNELDPAECHLIEPLRTMRLVNQAAWLAWRWDDPTFPMHFPWFGQARFWSDHILMLREQLASLQQPPIRPPGP